MADHDLIRTRTLEIQGSMGAFALVECEDFDFQLDRSIEVVVTTAGPIGFADDDKGGSFTLNVVSTENPEVNWYALVESKERVIFTAQDVDAQINPVGHRVQYRQARIEKCDPKTTNAGKQMIVVTGKFLTHKVIA